MNLDLGFEIDNAGGTFLVLIFPDFVLKIPRKKGLCSRRKLNEMAAKINRLADEFEEVLPVEVMPPFLVQESAKGIRCDKLADEAQWKRVQSRLNGLAKKCRSLGVEAKDLRPVNIYYDAENDRVSVIDVMHFREHRR